MQTYAPLAKKPAKSNIQANSLNSRKYTILLICVLFICLIIDSYFYRSGFGFLNNSFLLGLSGNNFTALLLSVTLSFALLFIMLKHHSYSITIALAGSLSNICDRLFYNGVVDYVKLFNWPIFNLADVLIVAGILLYSIQRAFFQPREI